MKTRTLSSAGALHPVLFFAGFYVVVLLFSIFICSSLFYSCSASKTDLAKKDAIPSQQVSSTTASSTAAVAR